MTATIAYLPLLTWAAAAVGLIYIVAAKPEGSAENEPEEVRATGSTSVARLRNPPVEFYESRTALNQARGGIQQEMKDFVGDAWMAAFTASFATNHGVFDRRRIKRLVLLAPYGEYLRVFVGAAGGEGRKVAEVQQDILTSTRIATRSEVEVRWHDGPITPVLIAGTDTPDGWFRVECEFPYWDDRLGYLVLRRDRPEAFDEIVRSFERLWAHSMPAAREAY